MIDSLTTTSCLWTKKASVSKQRQINSLVTVLGLRSRFLQRLFEGRSIYNRVKNLLKSRENR